MSHKNSLLFIGGVDKGHTPTNGETMKNQLYLDRFEEFFDIIHVIDTHNWKHRPWVFCKYRFTCCHSPMQKYSFPSTEGSHYAVFYIISGRVNVPTAASSEGICSRCSKKNKITFLRFRI